MAWLKSRATNLGHILYFSVFKNGLLVIFSSHLGIMWEKQRRSLIAMVAISRSRTRY
ncbi:hypothetical protein BU16DRAFT_528281 [Lophium mytilinum]|uniref:Uncharacterized protein n=1 Tax=Lophium mytilinum TaxID=390894 RepID=A0A6A6QQ39_9PEZI|nr:hypothetical protein BU16DRAFT_528281 [Lophium mytilinum]